MLFGNMSSRLLRQVTCAPRTCVSVGRELVAAHVFVESNWLFGYLAPAHHQVRAAVELFDRAMRDEFTLHLPNMCIGKARQAIRSKCQPRTEANAGFISWATPAGKGNARLQRSPDRCSIVEEILARWTRDYARW